MLSQTSPVTFIINPISGTADKGQIPLIINSLFGKTGANILFTEGPGHAIRLATNAVTNGAEMVVAVGGDGTMNEVASALIGSKTTLGLLPMGSGNGLVRNLGIPLQLQKALQTLIKGNRKLIDVGYLNGRPFFCTASIGFEAQVAQAFNSHKKRGAAVYLSTIISEFKNYKPQLYQIVANTDRFTEKAILFTMANANQFGNNAIIAPGALPNDGLLNLTLVKPVSALGAIGMAARLMMGTIHQSAATISGQYSRLNVQRETEGAVHVDGEPLIMGKELEFWVEKHNLWVCVP